MNQTVLDCLENKAGGRIFPFFWQHGEDEKTLHEYMAAIHSAGISAVCVESRPHPDFVGPKWWADMDVILDEARKRGMKVWILDDSHFPTGYANGALENGDPALARRSVDVVSVDAAGGESVELDLAAFTHPSSAPRGIEAYIMDPAKLRHFDDDRLVSAAAVEQTTGETVPLWDCISGETLRWDVPEGKWKICFVTASGNFGPHRSYINMMDERSVRVLLDTVYEPHWAHYRDDFGKTLAGFFSDEPELGNGHLYDMANFLGTDNDLPWSASLEAALQARLGADFAEKLPLLWDSVSGGVSTAEKARVRYAYMDCVTRLVEQNFSMQLGNWCRAHGVEYIGHLIEDNGQHARTGSSLGHYFRGLAGQDMAGIDDIGGQVIPFGEDLEIVSPLGIPRDGEFYHYALGKLGASLAEIDPLKKGRSMCEIFGAYGWSEGVREEKYLADHFLVRGINHFVPHAFSAMEYPDPDCPPHFYAGGNDPQFRHFGKLMGYMERFAALIDGGRRSAPAAILAHDEAEWTGERMQMQKPARVLLDAQIDFDFVPEDIFSEEKYGTKLGKTLCVGRRSYKVLIVPGRAFLSEKTAKAVGTLTAAGCPVLFVGQKPVGAYDGALDPASLEKAETVALADLAERLDALGVPEVKLAPANDRVRYLRYEKDGTLYAFVNEGQTAYTGEIFVPTEGPCAVYNAWDNRLERADARPAPGGTVLSVALEPVHSLIVVFGETGGLPVFEPVTTRGLAPTVLAEWMRSICRAKDYPHFAGEKKTAVPDDLAGEMPAFSGIARYETAFAGKEGQRTVLEITDAHEGVEVFVNGQSAGMQVVPPFVFDLTSFVTDGENTLAVEVATTLEREVYAMHPTNGYGLPAEPPAAPTGINGNVLLWQ